MGVLHLAVETAATQTKPAYRAMLLRTMLRKALRVAHHAGYKTLDFCLVRAGGLGLYSPRILF